jgi:hypothetical protein
MTTAVAERSLTERAHEVLRRSGNAFRNYFARNPDDEVCARYHVPELFAAERDLLLGVVDLYRYDPMTHSEVVPILGNKGAGKTHLLHSIKHGGEGAWQLLVTPGVYQKDTEFLEYLLFQIIDTLLGGGRQKGIRPLEYVGEELVRRLLGRALNDLNASERLDLFPAPGLGRWARRFGLGQTQAQERVQWLVDSLGGRGTLGRPALTVKRAVTESGLPGERAYELVRVYVEKTEAHNTAGLMRRALYQGFAKAVLLGDESDLASFVTFGFAELEFHVRPTRQDLVLALFKVLMEVFRTLKTPVVVAFDQLEDLLLARRSDDAHRVAEAFFAGIVQVMHQIDGLCFLIFAERGLWNRFVPSLDGYIQDRLNNPVHVPKHGTVKALRLEAPSPELVRRVVEARLRPALEELPDYNQLPSIYPFNDEQITRIAKTEPTLRDMLQQFRHLFDHIIYGPAEEERRSVEPRRPVSEERRFAPPTQPAFALPSEPEPGTTTIPLRNSRFEGVVIPEAATPPAPVPTANPRLSDVPPLTPVVKSMVVVQAPVTNDLSSLDDLPATVTPTAPEMPPLVASRPRLTPPSGTPVNTQMMPKPAMTEIAIPAAPAPVPELITPRTPMTAPSAMRELWEQEQRVARRKLEPEGALTGATRELQAGLGTFLQTCHEHGVKVGPWRLQHVVSEWTFGEHPTYGAISIAHWACKDGQPWKVGIGLFLGRGAGKPRDLEIKLQAMEQEPTVIDHLILLRPEDDLTLTGKSKSLWTDAERKGKHARIEAVSLDGFATIYSFPRWLASLTEALPEGQPVPNLADLIQDQCEKMLEQVCMPIQQ